MPIHDKLIYRDPHADVTFVWDGWMQILIRNGLSVPLSAWPDRFDIREPDLRRDDLKAQFPHYPDDPSVHFIPVTLTDLEDTCRTWMRGEHLAAGRRDYTTYPWQGSTYGWILGVLDVRYLGGDSIEATPRGTQNWRPIIDLAHDGHTPLTVATTWLQARVNGWILAFLARHGIDTASGDLHAAVLQWATTTLTHGASAASAYSAWLDRTVNDLWTSGDIETYRNAGGSWRSTASRRWYARRTAADGVRWNFLWTGTPFAYAYSPDRIAPARRTLLAHRPDAGHGLDGAQVVRDHLDHLADEWMRGPALDPDALTRWTDSTHRSCYPQT